MGTKKNVNTDKLELGTTKRNPEILVMIINELRRVWVQIVVKLAGFDP
jgi:hypothetical protein